VRFFAEAQKPCVEFVKRKILEDLKNISEDLKIDQGLIELSLPTDFKWGDYSTNLALKASKTLSKKPYEIAKEIEAKLAKKASGYSVRATENGFLNFTIDAFVLQKLVSEVLTKERSFGENSALKGKRFQVEFISANPTGPLTLGNGRGGFVGDVLSNILKFSGAQVEREYYVNNVGNQIKVLGYSISKELGLVSEEWDEFYSGPYIKDLAAQLQDPISILESRGDDNFYFEVGQLASEILLQEIQRVIKDKLGIEFDRYYLESTIYDEGKDQKMLSQLKDKGLTYEKDGATWFKTTDFGDDKDRVLVRSDGQPTYFLSDVVHKNEFAPSFDKLLLLLGADHYGYQERMKASLAAFGQEDKLQIIIFQLVRLIKDGQEVRMSKRSGNYVALEDLIDEVGQDAARFFFLMFAGNTHLNFDLELAKKKTSDNPVYYVQYAHARIASILSKESANKTEANLDLLSHPSELNLLKRVNYFRDLVEEVSEDYQVQKLPFYAMSLAESFHRFYQDCMVISDDKEMTASRLKLVKAVKIVLNNALSLMGISAPEKM
jgi:arginyl-tRNA synthetase